MLQPGQPLFEDLGLNRISRSDALDSLRTSPTTKALMKSADSLTPSTQRATAVAGGFLRSSERTFVSRR